MREQTSRARAAHRSWPPLLGGLISAAIVYLTMEDASLQPAAWIALTPFFHSLFQARDSAFHRLLHGLSFFGPLGFIYYRGPVYALLLGIHAGLFAVPAGALLTHRRAWVRALGLPALWVGLEVLRGPFSPLPQDLTSDWLAIGSTVEPGGAASQAAAWIGLHGMSFAAAASASLFASVLVEASFGRQIACALMGLAIPLTLSFCGAWLIEHQAASDRAGAVRVASQASGDSRELLLLTQHSASAKEGLLVWPQLSHPRSRDGDAASSREEDLTAAARATGYWALSAAAVEGAGDGPAQALLADPKGRLEAQPFREGEPIRFSTQNGTLAVCAGGQLDESGLPRKAAASGAAALVGVEREPIQWAERTLRHRNTLHRYRALENRRWLVHAGRRSAFVVDPSGREVLTLRGVDGAQDCRVEWLTVSSVYTRFGWWIEPILLASAAGILAWSLFQWLAAGRYNAGPVRVDLESNMARPT